MVILGAYMERIKASGDPSDAARREAPRRVAADERAASAA
jgi:hypothetical protein